MVNIEFIYKPSLGSRAESCGWHVAWSLPIYPSNGDNSWAWCLRCPMDNHLIYGPYNCLLGPTRQLILLRTHHSQLVDSHQCVGGGRLSPCCEVNKKLIYPKKFSFTIWSGQFARSVGFRTISFLWNLQLTGHCCCCCVQHRHKVACVISRTGRKVL